MTRNLNKQRYEALELEVEKDHIAKEPLISLMATDETNNET